MLIIILANLVSCIAALLIDNLIFNIIKNHTHRKIYRLTYKIILKKLLLNLVKKSIILKFNRIKDVNKYEQCFINRG